MGMRLPRGMSAAVHAEKRQVSRAASRAGAAVVAALALLAAGTATASADSGATASANNAETKVPATPTITEVVPGEGTAAIAYVPVFDGSVSGYQASPDGFRWFDCPNLSGSCTLVELSNGREYRVSLRAVNAAGTSPAARPVLTIPALALGEDPDKPAVLPRPRTRVTARFEAAGNSLGVRGARTKLGVGTLPTLSFSRAIPRKAAVESHLYVTATDKQGRTTSVPGSWGWTSDRTVIFRPKDYWPGNSTIRITSTIDDAVLGKAKGRYLIGSSKLARTYTFRTDRSLIAEVDGATKRMKVFIDGERVQDFPVSLGKAGWETRNGAKVISTDKEAFKVYRSASLGLTDPDDFYELDAPWNVRLTPTGEFLHSAPWAYGRLGRYNGSHGCTNMYSKDAKWIYDNTIPGDVVTFRRTGGDMMEPWNGPGGLWNIPWNKWEKKSALSSGNSRPDATSIDGDPADARPAGA